jgi:hypothetical protein
MPGEYSRHSTFKMRKKKKKKKKRIEKETM